MLRSTDPCARPSFRLAALSLVVATGSFACDDPGDAGLEASARSAEPDPDTRDLYARWQAAADEAFAPFLEQLTRTRSDEELPPIYAAWSKVNAGEVLPTMDDFAPQTASDHEGPVDDVAPPPLGLTDLYPCDRPAIGQLRFKGCEFDQQQRVEVAYDQIHFGLWRALQHVTWAVSTPDDAVAAARWSAQSDGANAAPVEYFGAFDRDRAHAVRGVLHKAWAQMSMVDEIEVNCWKPPTWWEWMFVPYKATVLLQSPCSWDAAMAHAFWVGHPALNPWVDDPAYEVCKSYFTKFESKLAGDLSNKERSYLGAVLLHEMIHFDVVGDCGGFPEPSCDSVGAIPAYRALLNLGEGYLKDSWSDAACDSVTNDGKCYKVEEARALADENAAHAIRSPSAYQYFAKAQVDMYRSGGCDKIGALCFPPDMNDPACGGEPPSCDLPGGSQCDQYPGIPGCACLDVDGGYLDDESGYADGAGSFMTAADDGQYCPGEDVVCGVVQTGCGDRPACQICGEDTNVGCPCDADSQCENLEPNLRCWGGNQAGWPQAPDGSGTCLPDGGTEASKDALEGMPWFCLDNCQATDQWDDMAICLYNQGSHDFDHGTCVHDADCGGYGPASSCEADGFVCSGSDVCGPECTDAPGDCQSIGFPDGYVCRTFNETTACVPPECQGGSLVGYCGLFAPEAF